MKGLAKRNNKTRGKTTRRKKSRGKTTRKRKNRGGSGGLENVVNEHSKRYTDTEIKTMKINFDQEYLSAKNEIKKHFDDIANDLKRDLKNIKFNGTAETKNDENEQPNKKKKTNNTSQDLAKAEDLIHFEYMKTTKARAAELTQLRTNAFEKMEEINEIEKNEHRAREKERIDERNYQTAMQKAEEEGVVYNPPSPSRPTDFMAPNQRYDPLSYPDYPDTADAERMGDMGDNSEWYGGKKRKYHKKRK